MIVLQNAIDAISLGAVYALAALGIGLIFSIMRLINFAHGELIMVGGFTLYGLAGQPYIVMALAAILVVTILALGMERRGLPAAAPRQSGDPADRLLRRLLSGAAYRADHLRRARRWASISWRSWARASRLGGLRVPRLQIATIIVTPGC